MVFKFCARGRHIIFRAWIFHQTGKLKSGYFNRFFRHDKKTSTGIIKLLSFAIPYGFFSCYPQSLSVAAIVVKPGKLSYKRFRQLDALGIYFEAPVINSAFSRHNIQVSAGDCSEEDSAVFVFNLFKAA
jgi:hypothetical protein